MNMVGLMNFGETGIFGEDGCLSYFQVAVDEQIYRISLME